MGVVHARAARLAGARIRAVATRTPQAASAAAELLGAERAYDSAEELVADPDVQVVHVCTPNYLHAPYARLALEAGKHVICEKPLGIDLTEATELRALAERAGVVSAVPFVYRYYPTVREAAARIADGQLGQMRLIHGSYLQDWLSRPSDRNWRVDPKLGGISRAFADIGAHWLDLVEFVSGDRITDVCATITSLPRGAAYRSARPGAQTEDLGAVIFRTASGVTGSLVVSQVSPGRKNRLWCEFDGSEASAVFDQENPDTLWLGGRDSNTVLHRGSDEATPAAQAVNSLPPGHPHGYTDCFNTFISHVYGQIRGTSHAGVPTFHDGERAAELVEAVLRSAANQTWIEIARAPAYPSPTT